MAPTKEHPKHCSYNGPFPTSIFVKSDNDNQNRSSSDRQYEFEGGGD